MNGDKGRQMDCIRTLNGLVKKGVVEVGMKHECDIRTILHYVMLMEVIPLSLNILS